MENNYLSEILENSAFECVMRRPGVTSFTTCSCNSHAADLYLSLLIKVTDLAFTECHAMRGHSVVLLHRCWMSIHLSCLLFLSVEVLADKILNWNKVSNINSCN